MSAAHFELLPSLALQLATRVDTYAAAMRLLAADPVGAAQRATVAASLVGLSELARLVSPLWSEWGRFVVAHAEFSFARVNGAGAAALGFKLMKVDACAEALMRKAVRWAIFEQDQSPVSFDTAQAFIEWEAARKVLFDLRQAAASQRIQRKQDADAAGTPSGTPDWQADRESKCAALLVSAVGLLQNQNEGNR